jgi:thioredoxin reductase (NADPH)
MNKKNDTEKLVIIGSGPAGLTAAVYAARANLRPILIEGNKPGGQLMGTSYIENWPGNKSILGPKLMQNMREHAEHFGTKIVSGEAHSVDFSNSPFLVKTDSGESFYALSVIIATGANPKKLGCPGEEAYWGKGVTTCAVCDGALYKNKPVVVIGGGDTAMEDAAFLRKFTDKITIVHILDKLTASHAMQQRVVNDKKINIIYNSTVTEFFGDESGLSGAMVTNQETDAKEKIEVDGAFIAIGLDPNTKIFKGQIELDNWGYVKVKDQAKTSVPGIFVAGDVHDFRYRQAVTAAGAGCKAALEAERYLAAKE